LSKAVALLVALILLSVHPGESGAQDLPSVRVLGWPDYISPKTNPGFTAKTGIVVEQQSFSGVEQTDALLKTGNSRQDVVVATDEFLQIGIPTGKFRKLDKAKLSKLATVDPILMRAAEAYDPEHLYSVPYAWGTIGIGYNAAMIQKRLGVETPSSWAMLFNPENAAKLADCGIAMIGAPAEVFQSVLIYLGRDPNSDRPEDYAAAEKALLAIRPAVRAFNSWEYIRDLANGRICVVLAWNSDVLGARSQGAEFNTTDIRFFTPREGAVIWTDNLAIPSDAPNPDIAMAYIDYLLEPGVAADNAAATGRASPLSPPLRSELIPAETLQDGAIYPDPKTKLYGAKPASPALEQLRKDTWARVTAAP